MAIDKAEWHYETFPEGMKKEMAATHIGMFFTWLLDNNMLDDGLLEQFGTELEKVEKREQTGAEFLFDLFDGALQEDMMTEEALEFAGEYYVNEYLDDYADALGVNGNDLSLYQVADSWDHYDRVEAMLDRMYEKWTNEKHSLSGVEED